MGSHARDYLWAWAKKDKNGNYVLENPEDQALYEKMAETSKIPGRIYRNSGPGDILSTALATKEPWGRARGIGVNVSHKRAFPLTKEERLQNKMQKKELKQKEMYDMIKKDLYPAIQKDIAAEIEESMKRMYKKKFERERWLMAGEAIMVKGANPTAESPVAGDYATLRKSSCASADPSPAGTPIADDDVSDLHGITCKLRCILTVMGGAVECANAQVIPLTVGGGLVLYIVLVQRCFVKCYVTEVFPPFQNVPLFNVRDDAESKTLGEALHGALESEPVFSPHLLLRHCHDEPIDSIPPAEASSSDQPVEPLMYRARHCSLVSSPWHSLLPLIRSKWHHLLRRRTLKRHQLFLWHP